KSESHTPRAAESARRDGAAQPSTPSSRNVTVTDAQGERFKGSAARTVSSRNIHGSERNRSEEISTPRSQRRPFQAAKTPATPESKLASSAAAGASNRETRVPWNRRDKRSRPSSSVPSGCVRE